MFRRSSILLLLLALVARVHASELVEVTPVTNRILLLHFSDGYVDHHGLGERHRDDQVFDDPLDLVAAMKPETYAITSPDDATFAAGVRPVRVGRKSKGSDFSTKWPDTPYVRDHWIYLVLPAPMERGRTYAINLEGLAANSDEITLEFDEITTRSETVHVNQLGYVPSSGAKFAYLSHWMGDLGPLSLDHLPGTKCHVVDHTSDAIVFSSTIRLRKGLDDGIREIGQTGEPGNLTGADVWECDFSSFSTPGRYRVAVDSVGSSFDFRINPEVYRDAFVTAARGLYHQRSGIELTAPYTEWVRPRDHHPAETDTVALSAWRFMDGSNAFSQLPRNATGEKRPFWGGWHDAGDWDRHHLHLRGSYHLLLVYELAPLQFADGELNIPESGNGIPDIIDEARWTVDLFRRMQREDGSVHGGLETIRHPEEGVASFTDTDQWYAYAPDPAATYHYAALAAQLSNALEIAGHADEGASYLEGALRAWEWAADNTPPADEVAVRDFRQFAAAWLFKVTGEDIFRARFVADNQIADAATELTIWDRHDQAFAVYTWVTTDRAGMDTDLKQRLRAAVLNWAKVNNLETAARRGFRFGYNHWRPTGVGAMTTPDALPLIVAHHLTDDRKYLDAQYAAADFYLGANPLNMVWVTGLGERYPKEVLHLDSWYLHEDAGREMVPGVVPYGAYRYQSGTPSGPWDEKWGMQSTYPRAGLWPTQELWFENRHSPITNEFTVHETIAPAAAAYGYLTSLASEVSDNGDELRRQGFLLEQNFPNPFRGATTINYTMLESDQVIIDVLDVLGRRVAVLYEGTADGGRHRMTFDAGGLAGGVYFLRMQVGDRMDARKIVLVR